jgi:hypothetical protein
MRKYQCTIDLLFDCFGWVCFANKNKICQLSYSWFQTSQTGGQQYNILYSLCRLKRVVGAKHSSLFVWKVSDEKEQFFFKIDKSQIVFVVSLSSTNLKGSNSWWGLSLSFNYIDLSFNSHWVQVKYLKR